MSEQSEKIVCLVWLEWPEKCFRVSAKALRFLAEQLPPNATLVRAKTERAFLRQLPRATHALVWQFKHEWFARAKNLRELATPSAGRELVAWQNAPHNVAVHFGTFHGAVISEAVAGFVLAWAHGFFHPALRQADNARAPWRTTWPRAAISDACFCVAKTKAVIAGFGRVGRAIGEKLAILGVEVEGFSRAHREKFERAIRTADWLILALPSDTDTDHFLNRARIAKLSRKCVVINVGRGNAIDEEALVEALREKRIAGAYLDVFASEPGLLSSVGKPASRARTILATRPRELPPSLIKMPHASAFSDDYLVRFFAELKDANVFR